MYNSDLGRWFSIDPLAEKYYPWSPYNYCLNNPVIYLDTDGKDPKKLSHWIRFFKETWSATTANVSVGLQLAGKVDINGQAIGIDVNLASKDLVGVTN